MVCDNFTTACFLLALFFYGITRSNTAQDVHFKFKREDDDAYFNTTQPVCNHLGMESKKCSNYQSCPPWFQCKKGECKCGPTHHHSINCNETLQTSAVLDCYCVTYDESRNTTVAGACFYNCENNNKKLGYDKIYHQLPSNISKLNEFMCDHHWLRRTGPLCGQCFNDTYPLVYSYNMSCVDCPDGKENWWKFILAAFLPLTVFYFIVLFLNINATSSYLYGYVFYSHAISVPAFVRIVLPTLINSPHALRALEVIISLYGVWSLDIFRALIPNICLQTTTLQTLALDYTIAVYPLFLMIISYVLIELHDHNFRVVVLIWKPFRYVFTFFHRNWDSRTSVIDAYATFFLLSFMKFLSVSFDILIPADLHAINSKESTLVLYYDGSIEYFGEEHLPYAILAISILLLFILLPMTVLFLYPFKFFQKFLSCFPNRWITILRTFVDSFLGSYKDGTEPGTRDCRWFANVLLITRILALIIYSITVGGNYFPGAVLLMLIPVLLYVTVQPYKPEFAHYTRINVTFVLFLVFVYSSITGLNMASIKGVRFITPYFVCILVFTLTPLMYMSCIVIHWLFSQRKWGKNLVLKFRAWRQGYNWRTLESDHDQTFEESLPDRILNPDQYHEGNLSDFRNLNNESRNKDEQRWKTH